MAAFIFGGDTQETPESIKRKRDVVRALLAAQGAPRNVGEGLNALGDGIVANVLDRRADKAEKAGLDSANSAFSSLFSGGGGSGDSTSIPMTGAATEVNAGAPASSPDIASTEAYIRDAAAKRGIDPDIAVKVARSEGLGPGVWQSNVVRGDGRRETSYGPFQLLVGGGLGDKFQKMYGKSPADPSTVNQQIDFALDEAASGGWSPWYGAAKVGVGARTGLEKARALGMQQPAAQEVASAQPTTASDAIAAQAPQIPPVQTGYVDPQVTTASRGAVQALTAPPQAAPQLPPPTNVASAPPVASVPQQVAQAAPQQTPAQALAGGPSMQQLIQASQNKFLSEGQRGVVNALLKQKLDQQEAEREIQLKQADPAYQVGLEKGRLEVDKLKNPPKTRVLTADEKQQMGLPANIPFQMGPDGEIDQIGGKGTNVTVNTGENNSKFVEESDKAASGRLNDIVTAGNAAPQMMGDLQNLAELGKQIGTGRGAQTIAAFGPYAQALGIDVKGLDEVQAYQAIVNRLAPQMRPAGSGATSDFDAKQFLTSLPSLGNTPGGNELILQTFSALQQNKIAAAEIAAKAQSGEIKWQEAEKQIRQLGNPYEAFKKMQDAARKPAAENPMPSTPGANGEPDFSKMSDEELRRFIDGK